MSRHTIPLRFPVDFGGERVTEVSLRRPKGREIRQTQNGKGSQIDRSFQMMANLAEVEVELIDELDAADVRRIDKWLDGVMGEEDPQDGSS